MKKEENEEKDKLFLGMISVLQQGVPSFNFFFSFEMLLLCCGEESEEDNESPKKKKVFWLCRNR